MRWARNAELQEDIAAGFDVYSESDVDEEVNRKIRTATNLEEEDEDGDLTAMRILIWCHNEDS